MEPSHHFLLIGIDDDVLSLFSRNIRKHFPAALLSISDDADHALAAVEASEFDAVVVMESLDKSGPDMASTLLRACPGLPVLLLFDTPKAEAAVAVGAPALLSLDHWNEVGPALEALSSSVRVL
jgi:hypothetical protein